MAVSKKKALEFFAEDGLRRMFLVRRCLQPQITLMSQMLAMNSALWDLKQFHLAAANEERQYRLQQLFAATRPGGMFRTFLDETRQQMNAEVWSHLDSTQQTATDVFRISCRGAAVLMEQLVLKALSFPCVVFSLLCDDEEVDSLLEHHMQYQCCLDPFSRYFLSKFHSRELLLSQEARALLLSIAQFAIGNIYNTERLHTRNALRSRQRATHKLALHHLSMWHMTDAGMSCFHAKSGHGKRTKKVLLHVRSQTTPCPPTSMHETQAFPQPVVRSPAVSCQTLLQPFCS